MESLDIENSQITDKGLKSLHGLKHLKREPQRDPRTTAGVNDLKQALPGLNATTPRSPFPRPEAQVDPETQERRKTAIERIEAAGGRVSSDDRDGYLRVRRISVIGRNNQFDDEMMALLSLFPELNNLFLAGCT